MNQEQEKFLHLPIRPARLSAQQTAWALGFQNHDIAVLVSARLLKPLGDPKRNAQKYFARFEISELEARRDWLHKATGTIFQYWVIKNANRNNGDGDSKFPEA